MEKENFNPLVSIIIPVYNGENFLKEAITSALSQTYSNIEIIVVNDGSKDLSEKIAKSFGDKIRYYKKKNGGVASALNFGITKMKGEYFSWLSHDDMYSKDKIKNQIEYLKKIEDKDSIIMSNYCFVDSDGNYLYSYSLPKELKLFDYGLNFLFARAIHGCAILVPKKMFDTCGMFDENLPTTQDYDMWFRLLRNRKAYFLKSEDILCRDHEEQGSKKFITKHIEECNALWINIISNVSEKEMIELRGSISNFYQFLYEFLCKNTLYDKAIAFAREKFATALLNEKEKLNNYFVTKFGISYPEDIYKSNKTKLVFGVFGGWFDKGGLNRVVANISNELFKYYDVVILSTGDKSVGYDINENINYLNMQNVLSKCTNFIEDITLFLLLLKTNIYVNLYNCSELYLNLLDSVNKTSIKTIAWNHEYYFLPYANSDYYRICLIRNEIFSRTNLVLWLTNSSNIVYRQFFNNSCVMHNALTLKEVKTIKITEKKNNIIAISRFDDKRKNLEGVIRTAFELKKINSSFKINILGNYDLSMLTDDKKTTLESLIEELNVNDVLIFKGFVSDVSKEYKDAKVNIMTSYHEGFGLTIIESAQHGIPTVAFNDSGYEDIIDNNKSGYLVDRNDYKAFAEKINILLTNDDKLKEFSAGCLSKTKIFEKSIIIDKWKKIIDSVVSNNIQNTILDLDNFHLSLKDIKFNMKNCCFQYENAIQKICEFTEISTNNKEVELLKCENAELKEEIQKIQSSKSMKITAPLRKIIEIINDLKS